MFLGIKTKTQPAFDKARSKRTAIRGGAAFIALLCFSLPNTVAHSHEKYSLNSFQISVSREALKEKPLPPSAVADACTPLLKTAHDTSSALVTRRNQRTAGKVAALGMILGARFALEPTESHQEDPITMGKARLAHKNVQARSAQAIAAYRQCQKDRALDQLASR